jgi:GLPGLI family protein
MKKILTGVTLILLTMVSLMPLAKAQKAPFTGTVVYDVKTVGDVPEQAQAMMPTESTMKMTSDKMIQVMHSSMMDIKTINDATAQVSNMLMDMMGQKLNIRNTAAQIADQKKQLGMEITIKPATETKTIAGYLCKRAIMTMKSNQTAEQTYDVYYTEDIDVSKFTWGNSFPNVNGLPLEFTMNQGPFTIKMTAKSVKKESIPESEFVIPTDFKQVTQDELRQMFGGGGQ